MLTSKHDPKRLCNQPLIRSSAGGGNTGILPLPSAASASAERRPRRTAGNQGAPQGRSNQGPRAQGVNQARLRLCGSSAGAGSARPESERASEAATATQEADTARQEVRDAASRWFKGARMCAFPNGIKRCRLLRGVSRASTAGLAGVGWVFPDLPRSAQDCRNQRHPEAPVGFPGDGPRLN